MDLRLNILGGGDTLHRREWRPAYLQVPDLPVPTRRNDVPQIEPVRQMNTKERMIVDW